MGRCNVVNVVILKMNCMAGLFFITINIALTVALLLYIYSYVVTLMLKCMVEQNCFIELNKSHQPPGRQQEGLNFQS